MARTIKAPVALNGITYRAGQEDELRAAAQKAGTDLTHLQGTSLDGDWSADDEGGSAPDATASAAELAEAEGLDLSAVTGTGADGRILKSDVESALKERAEGGA